MPRKTGRTVTVTLRLDQDAYAKLEQLVLEARARGATNASAGMMARSLFLAALALPEKQRIASELLMRMNALEGRLGRAIARLFAENAQDVVASALAEAGLEDKKPLRHATPAPGPASRVVSGSR